MAVLGALLPKFYIAPNKSQVEQVLMFYHLKTRHCVITALLQVSENIADTLIGLFLF